MAEAAFPYEIIEEFSRGGCSVLYKLKPHADASPAGEFYVLKTMFPDERDASSIQRFYMEYEFLRAYPHANLVKVREYYSDWQGVPAYVMEWITGATWQAYWQDRTVLDCIPLLISLLNQLCDVLDFIHTHHIIHRDLKPQNILVTRNNMIKLIDFGIMKVENLTLYTSRNTFMGSAYYVAPECLSGDRISSSADIFSLGVLLYDLLTGTKPFFGHTLAETVYQRLVTQPKAPSEIADLPKEIDDVIMSMLDKEPYKRPKTCREAFEKLEKVLSRLETSRKATRSISPIDFLSQDQFFHTRVLDLCLSRIQAKNSILITGGAGTGKTTVAENLALKCGHDLVIKINCQPHITQSDFIEISAKSIQLPGKITDEMKPWVAVLGHALPQLNWPVPRPVQQVHKSGILSSFLRLLANNQEPLTIIVENLQDAAPTFFQFFNQLVSFVTSQTSPRVFLIMTAEGPVRELLPGVPNVPMTFPDLFTMSDFLSGHFGQCRVPLEVTDQLTQEAEENLAKFLKNVQERTANKTLWAESNVLKISDHRETTGKPPKRSSTIPLELMEFNRDQLKHLEWVALCPNGVDLQILKKVTKKPLEDLGQTLRKAAKEGLLDYASSSIEGFHWKKERVRTYLVGSLSDEERIQRNRVLAEVIEEESKNYLQHSPPLWLVLSQLYLEAGEDGKASRFALDYAKYCFHNANYGPIRRHLSPFVSLPDLQRNLDFWVMLALAFRREDAKQALSFGKRALSIEENIKSLSLNAILEFDVGNRNQANALLDRVFSRSDLDAIDVNSASQMIPILVSLGFLDRATRLYELMREKLKGEDHLFANNVLFLAKARLLQPTPKELIEFVERDVRELLPQTEIRINYLLFLAYVERFNFDKASKALNQYLEGLLDDRDKKIKAFRGRLYLLLNFHRFEEAKALLADFKRDSETRTDLQELDPLVRLATEFLIQDPNFADATHVFQLLHAQGDKTSEWLTLFLSLLEPSQVNPAFAEKALEFIDAQALQTVRNQIPRLRVLEAYAKKVRSGLDKLALEAVENAALRHLEMEKLRLYLLMDFLVKKQVLKPSVQPSLPAHFKQDANATHFVKTLSFHWFQQTL